MFQWERQQLKMESQMANPMKGQIKVKLGDKEYNARLTIDAIMQIEDAVGCGIIKLATKMADADIRMSDVVTVLLHALRGGGKDLQESDIKKIVQNTGIVESTAAMSTLIAQSLSSDSEEKEGKKKG